MQAPNMVVSQCDFIRLVKDVARETTVGLGQPRDEPNSASGSQFFLVDTTPVV
jgi:hypothetical protein